MICFNCSEEGHIGSQYLKPKRAQSSGKVFALVEDQTAAEDGLIRGTCFINTTPLITIIDTGAMHCFVAADCVERLGLVLSSLNGEMVIDTPAKGSVTTSFVCAKCPLSIFDIDFCCTPKFALSFHQHFLTTRPLELKIKLGFALLKTPPCTVDPN